MTKPRIAIPTASTKNIFPLKRLMEQVVDKLQQSLRKTDELGGKASKEVIGSWESF